MSLSDCSKCWDTPCCCGYSYEGSSYKYLFRMFKLFGKLIIYKFFNKKFKSY